MTAGEALARAGEALRGRSLSARADATRLLEHVLDRDAAWLLAHADAVLTVEEAARFEAATARRARGEPVAYLTGTAGFYGRSFRVTPDVLVPRPETELLVELALEHLRRRAPRRPAAPCVLDVGTGSGVLAIVAALELPAAAVTAVDVSAAALAVAASNARALGVAEQIAFVAGDLTAALPGAARYDVVFANLPYVPSALLAPAPDPTSFEPRLALDGGPDGLDLYRRLLAEGPGRLAAGGLLLMEAAPGTAGPLAALATAAFGGAADTRVVADPAGLERVVAVRLGGSAPPGAKTNRP